jgi:glutathione S-transferase
MDGSFKLAESSAILLYLCEKYPQIPKSLSGQTIQERALVNQYLSWYQNEFRTVFFEPISMRKRYLLTGEVGSFTTTQDEFAHKRIHMTARLLDRLLKIKN